MHSEAWAHYMYTSNILSSGKSDSLVIRLNSRPQLRPNEGVLGSKPTVVAFFPLLCILTGNVWSTQMVSNYVFPSNCLQVIRRPSTYCIPVRKYVATILQEIQPTVKTSDTNSMQISHP